MTGALRWTVDTPEDLELVRSIFAHFGGRDDFSWLDVLACVEQPARAGADQRRVSAQGLSTRWITDQRSDALQTCRSSDHFYRAQTVYQPAHRHHPAQRHPVLAGLGAEVEVILVGEEAGMAAVAASCGVSPARRCCPQRTGHAAGQLDLCLARQASDSPCLAYVNADILLLPDVAGSRPGMSRQAQRFLIVGQRWDLDVREPLDFTPGWEERLRPDAHPGQAAPARQAAITSSFRVPASPICPISPSGAPAGITG